MKREYYDVGFLGFDRFSIEKRGGLVLFLAGLFLPVLILIGIATFLSMSVSVASVLKVVGLILCVCLSFAWMIGFGFLWQKIERRRKYPLRIPDADRYVRISPVTGEEELVKLEKTGGLTLRGEPDSGTRKFIYNFFTDFGLRKGEEITIRSIDRDLFLKHYRYYEEKYYEYTTLYVVPFDELGTDQEGYDKIKGRDPRYTNLFFNFGTFEDVLDGAYNEFDFGIRYRYRNIRKGLSEGTT